jgi:hypothetical protein
VGGSGRLNLPGQPRDATAPGWNLAARRSNWAVYESRSGLIALLHRLGLQTNLLVTMLDKAGVPGVERLGDSTGKLELAASTPRSADASQRKTL